MTKEIEKAKRELREAEHKYSECINDCSEFADKARVAANATMSDTQLVTEIPDRSDYAKPKRSACRSQKRVTVAELNNHPSWDPLLNTTQAASYIGRHPETLREMARSREIATVRTSHGKGSEMLFRLSALNAWVKSHEIKALPVARRQQKDKGEKPCKPQQAGGALVCPCLPETTPTLVR